MLATDKTITTKEYWDSVYNGSRNDAKTDASNFTRPAKSFDRFDIVVNQITADEKIILGIGSGHARIEERLAAKYPDKLITASDQSSEARRISNYKPYCLFSAYEIPFSNKYFDVVIATQCLEYMEFQDKAVAEFKRVGKKFLCTIPLGEMKLWSQLQIFNEKDFCEWISKYGEIEVKENYGELLLVKIKFYE